MDRIKRERKNWFYAYNLIFDIEIDSNAKLVYLCLCRYADNDDRAYPSHRTIGVKCGIKSRTTIKKAIDMLMSVGLLDWEEQRTQRGGQTSNIYTIYNEPNEKVKQKYIALQRKSKPEAETPRALTAPVHQMDTPCPANEQLSDQQMGTPCPSDEHPSAQQMDTPCSADGHKKYLYQNLQSFKNPSFNHNDLIDEELQGVFEKSVIFKDGKGSNADIFKIAVLDLWRSGRAGKRSGIPKVEIKAAILNCSLKAFNDMMERYSKQLTTTAIVNPREYLKTMILQTGGDEALKHIEKQPVKSPSYDIDEFVRLQMERLHNEE